MNAAYPLTTLMPPSSPKTSPAQIWLERGALFGLPVAISAWRFTPILQRMTDAGGGDFLAHIRFAQEIAETGQVTIPHFGYEVAVIAVHALRPESGWPAAALLVSLTGVLITTLLLSWWVARAVPQSDPVLRVAAAIILSLALLTVQPALLPWGPLVRDPWFVGHFPANQYHNPTTLLSRPLTLALFGFGLSAAFGGVRRGAAVAGCAGLVLISGLVKPSFLMAFLPAVGAIAVVNWKRADWRLLILGLGIPTAGLLAAQFTLRYLVRSDDGVSIAFAPLMVLGLYGPTDLSTLATRLALSVLFPLIVTVLFFRRAVRDQEVVLSWLTLAVGVSYGYLLAETGGKGSSGDFLWSGQLAAFLLFAVSTMFLLRQLASARSDPHRAWVYGRAAVCGLLLAWHVVSGVQHLQMSWFD